MSENRPCLFCGETANVTKTPERREFTFDCQACGRRYVVGMQRMLRGVSDAERPAFEKLARDAKAKGLVARLP